MISFSSSSQMQQYMVRYFCFFAIQWLGIVHLQPVFYAIKLSVQEFSTLGREIFR